MKYWQFIKSRYLFILLQVAILSYLGLFLSILSIQVYTICFVIVFIIVFDFLYLTFDYLSKRKFYNEISDLKSTLDSKVLNLKLMNEPDFIEGKQIYELLIDLGHFLNNEIADQRANTEDFRSYLEGWIHEIKIPIAVLDLLCENNPNELSNAVLVENKKIYSLVEQALYYSKANYINNDFIIKAYHLDAVINGAVRESSVELIKLHASISISNVDYIVYSDNKWLTYILTQVISNSIKYHKENLVIKIKTEQHKDAVVLSITDNGIGISSQDLPRVFEKGFTGENGRTGYKSTGIGLFLAKKMALRMGMDITIESKQDVYTKVMIKIPGNDDFLKVTKMSS